MRFGTYVFRISPELKADHQIIENTLREVELAEEIGLDAVWLTEHHFDGAVAYADPVVFAAAVAAKTKKVRIGFAGGGDGAASSRATGGPDRTAGQPQPWTTYHGYGTGVRL